MVVPPSCPLPQLEMLLRLLASLALLLAGVAGYVWQPDLTETFPWRQCTAFEATKKNCPKGEPCWADLR